jgi:2-polyprenyl-3-methyl-5-hydroxy-6-metoxy-1,4-benzoquinol methylase
MPDDIPPGDQATADAFSRLGAVDLDALSRDEMLTHARRLRALWDQVERACVRRAQVDEVVFREKSMPQSELFMAEIIPVIHRLYFNFPYNGTIEVLDVGPQTFAGTRLLTRLHGANSFSNLKMAVSTLDIHDRFIELKELVCPDVAFIKSDVFDVRDRTWDLVICSHVVEHVPEPLQFLRRLQALARRDVIVATPWNENPITTKGHVNTIDKALVRQAGARDLQIYTNFMWGKTREVCIFTLPGKAPAGVG